MLTNNIRMRRYESILLGDIGSIDAGCGPRIDGCIIRNGNIFVSRRASRVSAAPPGKESKSIQTPMQAVAHQQGSDQQQRDKPTHAIPAKTMPEHAAERARHA